MAENRGTFGWAFQAESAAVDVNFRLKGMF
jgi:hypothetical protein